MVRLNQRETEIKHIKMNKSELKRKRRYRKNPDFNPEQTNSKYALKKKNRHLGKLSNNSPLMVVTESDPTYALDALEIELGLNRPNVEIVKDLLELGKKANWHIQKRAVMTRWDELQAASAVVMEKETEINK